MKDTLYLSVKVKKGPAPGLRTEDEALLHMCGYLGKQRTKRRDVK